MKASVTKALNIRSVLSKRVKTRRKRLMRPKSRSISLRRSYSSASNAHGSTRFSLGGTTGSKPRDYTR